MERSGVVCLLWSQTPDRSVCGGEGRVTTGRRSTFQFGPDGGPTHFPDHLLAPFDRLDLLGLFALIFGFELRGLLGDDLLQLRHGGVGGGDVQAPAFLLLGRTGQLVFTNHQALGGRPLLAVQVGGGGGGGGGGGDAGLLVPHQVPLAVGARQQYSLGRSHHLAGLTAGFLHIRGGSDVAIFLLQRSRMSNMLIFRGLGQSQGFYGVLLRTSL